jgi:hypothetical protein
MNSNLLRSSYDICLDGLFFLRNCTAQIYLFAWGLLAWMTTSVDFGFTACFKIELYSWFPNLCIAGFLGYCMFLSFISEHQLPLLERETLSLHLYLHHQRRWLWFLPGGRGSPSTKCMYTDVDFVYLSDDAQSIKDDHLPLRRNTSNVDFMYSVGIWKVYIVSIRISSSVLVLLIFIY